MKVEELGSGCLECRALSNSIPFQCDTKHSDREGAVLSVSEIRELLALPFGIIFFRKSLVFFFLSLFPVFECLNNE